MRISIKREVFIKLNRTALHAVEILKLISKEPDGITLDEIYEKLNIPKTGGYNIMTTLVQTGMMHVTREQKQHYTIGLTAYRTGINYTNDLDFISTTDPALKAFSREAGRTVFFGTRTDDTIVYICEFGPKSPIVTTATVGTKNPIYCMSLGKAIMAFTGEEEVRQVLEHITFKKHTGRTLGTREEFEKELERMREKGYASDARELEKHIECVGAPVLKQGGNVMGAISVSSPYRPIEDYGALGRQVQAKAVEISRLLGFLGKC